MKNLKKKYRQFITENNKKFGYHEMSSVSIEINYEMIITM